VRKVDENLPAHLERIDPYDENPPSSSRIIIVRMVDMVGGGTLSACLREEISGGAVIEMTRIHNMINAGPATKDRSAISDGLHSLLSVSARSLLRARYSPLLILGAISGDGLDELRSNFTGMNVTSVSLYLSDRALTRQYRQMRARTLYTMLSPPDLLTKLRARRTLDGLKLEEARSWNSEICATRDRADCSFDVSNQDPKSIFLHLSSLI